jgi:hypothetical protein
VVRAPSVLLSVAESGPRPRSLLVLIAVLCWETGRGIEGLVLPARSTTYQFFQTLGLAPVHFVLDTLAVAVALASLGYLWRARPGWAKTVLAALGYFSAYAIAVTLLMLRDPVHARVAFVASREARGEPADAARVEQVFALGFLEWRLVMSLTLFALAAWLAWRGRDYVGPEDRRRR